MREKIGVVCTIVYLIGFLIVLGAAGSLELDTITVIDFIKRAGIGLFLIVIGVIGSNVGGRVSGYIER